MNHLRLLHYTCCYTLQLGTTGFVNAHLEDETPLFQKSRINLDSLGRDEKVVQMVAASGS